MSGAAPFLSLLFALSFGAVAVFALRNRLLGRLAYREVFRRKGQTAMVIAGLMVGTATITASFVAADSVGASVLDAFAYNNWYQTDITVGSSGRFFPVEAAAQLADSPDVNDATDGISPGIQLIGSASDRTTRLGSSQVALIGFDPSSQEPFGRYVLADGSETLGDDLAPGEVLVSRILADKIDAKTGDLLILNIREAEGSASAEPVPLRVAGIAKAEGPGAFTLGSAVFAPLATAQSVARTAQINVIRVSAIGSVRDTEDSSKRAMRAIKAALPTIDSPDPLKAVNSKADEIAAARESTAFITAMLVGMSSLVVAVGAALVVNLIGMLSEERRSNMGVIRALGLKRRKLIGLSTVEGALYSIFAGLVGVAVGVAAGYVVASRFGKAFAEFAGQDFDFNFRFAFTPATLVAGFCSGTVLTLIVIYLTSRRTSRMTITAAIRNLPEPPKTHGERGTVRKSVMTLVAVAGAAIAITATAFPRLAGGVVTLMVISAFARGRMTQRAHATATGLALVAWAFWNIWIADQGADVNTFFLIFVAAILVSVFGLTLVASANLQVVEKGVGVLGHAVARLRAILRPPLAYLARRPVRTGLTTGVFAVIVSMLTLFAVLLVVFGSDYQQFGAGYDVRIASTGADIRSVPARMSDQVEKQTPITTVGYVGPLSTSQDDFQSARTQYIPLFTLPTVDGASASPIALSQYDEERYPTDKDVWNAIERNPRLVVSNLNFLAPGTKIRLTGENGPVIYKVVAIGVARALFGMFGSTEAFQGLTSAPLGSTLMVKLKPGVDAGAFAKRAERIMFDQGVQADSVQELLETDTRANRAFFSTIDVLMRMGLVVGILALGIVALRVVTERRQIIGMMRAVGYQRRDVLAGLITESAATATIGAIVGIIIGVAMGYVFYRQNESSTRFGIDLGHIGGVLALLYLSVLIVTIWPAWRASNLPPAEAVRYSE